MDKPTRGQWRGYIILSGILSLLLLALIFWPLNIRQPLPSDNSELQKVVSLYGDEIRSTQKQSTRLHYSPRRDSFPVQRRSNGKRRYINPYDTLLVDINTADTARLQQLRGIGPVFASRIVKYRNLLGGFVDIRQLLEVYGMDENRFSSIEPHLTASSLNVRKMKINSASFEELRRHPYLDYYQARAIVDYRRTVGPVRNPEDLLKINLVDEETIRKISDYIQYN